MVEIVGILEAQETKYFSEKASDEVRNLGAPRVASGLFGKHKR